MPGSSHPIGDRSRILGSMLETVLHGIQIIGSIAGTQVDMAEVFQLQARGRTHVTSSGARWSRSTSPSLTSWRPNPGADCARPWVGDDHQ
jgi:hypothetical protein